MKHHYRLLSDTKQQYGLIFQRHQAELEAHLRERLGAYSCAVCQTSHPKAIKDWLTPLPTVCGYREWQQDVLTYLEQAVASDILRQLQKNEQEKNRLSCHLCGMCCRMASADAPYEEMQRRATQGDEFARQFTSVFLPYASREAARQIAPDVVDAVLSEATEELGGEERVFFYHCPYVGEDNRCSLFGTDKRPAMCGTYPETPLSFVYSQCAWRPWKDEFHAQTLATHALLALCSHWAEQLRAALSTSESKA